MPASTLTRDGSAGTLGAPSEMPREFTGSLVSAGTGTDKAGAAQMLLDAALIEARRRYERLAGRFEVLLTAAQAAVIEARTSRRNPLTPLTEALAELGELPGHGVRLADVVAESMAAWPRGAAG